VWSCKNDFQAKLANMSRLTVRSTGPELFGNFFLSFLFLLTISRPPRGVCLIQKTPSHFQHCPPSGRHPTALRLGSSERFYRVNWLFWVVRSFPSKFVEPKLCIFRKSFQSSSELRRTNKKFETLTKSPEKYRFIYLQSLTDYQGWDDGCSHKSKPNMPSTRPRLT
jgi:hypothetical protein